MKKTLAPQGFSDTLTYMKKNKYGISYNCLRHLEWGEMICVAGKWLIVLDVINEKVKAQKLGSPYEIWADFEEIEEFYV